MDIARRLRRVALWKKFMCLGLLCLAVISLPTFLYWKEVQKSLVFSEKEQVGLPQLQLVLNIIQRTQQHRGISAGFLHDSSMSKREQRSKAEDVEAAIFSYEKYIDKNPNDKLKADFSLLVEAWHKLHRKVAHQTIDYRESFDQHTLLIYKQLQYLQTIVDYYQLSLDPEADGYFLIEASLVQLPQLAEILAQVRGYGVGMLAKGDSDFAERSQMSALLLASQSKIASMDSGINKAVAARKSDQENIQRQYDETKIQYKKIIDLINAEIISKQAFNYAPEKFYSVFTTSIDSYYLYAQFSIQQLDVILNERIVSAERHMFALLSYVLCLTLIVAWMCLTFIRRLLKQLGGEPYYTMEVVQAITQGDLAYTIDTVHPDSLLGQVQQMQEKLKENDRLKSEFVSTVSHELRTPLTAIGGALSLAVSGQLGAMPAPALRLLDIAQKNSSRLTELINDLLDIDKLSIGKLELTMIIQPLMPIIDDACVSMTSYAQKYGVHIVMGPRFEYLLVKVDARRLRQVLINFLSNAAKFSKRGGEIFINIHVHMDKVKIEVVDQGQGIPNEFHDKIFERFSQADSSDSRSAGGTGLGLAIAKELVQKMDGIIGFSSTPGVGSCFYIELPLEEPNSD